MKLSASNTQFNITEISLLKKTCSDILSKIKTPAVFFIEGEVGAGKTTFIKHFVVNYLHVKKIKFDESLIHSPTYNLHNKYHVIDHFDLYRIEEAEEISNSGLFEFLNISNHSIVFIEWPKFAKNLSVWEGLNIYHIFIVEKNNERFLYLS